MREIKKIISLILLLLSFSFAYADENSFFGVIKFDKIVHNFGDILLSDGPLKCKFTYTNIGKEPLVIYEIVTSCGCTDPKWDKKPVMPGKTGEIEVLFLNDQGPYPFDKTLTVYVSGGNKPIYLHIRGIVHEKKKSLRELYPYIYDNSLGLRNNGFSISYIDQGESKTDEAEVINISKSPIKVSFKNVTPGLSVDISPNPLQPGSKGVMRYTIDTKENSKNEWGKTKYKADIVINNKSLNQSILFDAFIKENFSSLSDEERKNAPLPMLSKSSEDFGNVKKGEILRSRIVVKNQGKRVLNLYKAESNIEGVTFAFPKSIDPGKEGVIEIELNTSKSERELMAILTIITNSPTRPFVNYFITATVE